MRLVAIESPYSGSSTSIVDKHMEYAKKCLNDCLSRGEAPIASHMLYTQVLNDSNPIQRELGINAGLAWKSVAEITIVYTDYGISSGMQKGIEKAYALGKQVIFRKIL